MNSSTDSNQRAISALQTQLTQEKETEILQILRNNKSKHSSTMTLNNLGVFYCEFGMILPDGKRKRADALGLRYLQKATTIGRDWRAYANIATALAIRQADPRHALETTELICDWLKKAYAIHQDPVVLSDIGACLFLLGQYKEAAKVFSLLHGDDAVAALTSIDLVHPVLAEAHCYFRMGDKSKIMDCLQGFSLKEHSWDSLQYFELLYACGQYQQALAIYKNYCNYYTAGR